MSSNGVREEFRQRRLDRMRQGQSAVEYVELPSDPEIRFALVPVSDAERSNALIAAANLDVPDNVAGIMARDHVQKVELLACSLRDPVDTEKRIFRDAKDLQEEMNAVDLDHIYDIYLEMTENSNPSIDGIPPEEFDELKKALQEISWNDLSGRSWYAAKRFLGAVIREGQLRGNSRGFSSTMKSTTTSG
jgi:hypothetical protein